MMNKMLMIGGGVAAVATVVFVSLKMRGRPADTSQSQGAQMQPDQAFFSSLAPISGGYSSGDMSGGGGVIPVITDPNNSGSSSTGGGFDIASLFKTMFESQAATNQLGIITGGYNYDSSVLASIIGMNGTANVTHDANGTTLTNKPGEDVYSQIVTDLYKTNLGRAPELGGLTFWKNQLMNGGLSVTGAQKEMQNSAEYQKLMAAAPQPSQGRAATTGSTTTTTNPDGTTTTTVQKTQA